MHVGFEALPDHADGVANTILRIDDKFVRKDVEDFAIFRERNVAGSVDGAAHVVAFDVARAIAKRHAAPTVDAADVASSYAD